MIHGQRGALLGLAHESVISCASPLPSFFLNLLLIWFLLSNRLDPIWTLKTGSLFILTTESRKLFLDDGMRFIVKDFDQLGKDEVLGTVHVKPQVWYQSKGERMEFKLQPPHGSKDTEVPGYLVLRIRRASEYDQKFMADYNNTKGNQGVASVDHPKATTNFVKTMTTFNKRKDKSQAVEPIRF